MLSELTASQRALAEYMSDLSEDASCAGWLVGLEYVLWETVLDRRTASRWLAFAPSEVARLRDLAQDCGGWIVFDDTTQETWLPMAEWERRFAEWEKRTRPEDR
jgi:hypothetical protein